jgi:hypothetical protein
VTVSLWAGIPSLAITQEMWPLVGFAQTRVTDLPFTLICVVLPALAVLGFGLAALRRAPRDPGAWAAVLNACLVLSVHPPSARLAWHSGRLATGLVAASLLAVPLRRTVPRVFAGLAAVYAGSALWTVAVVIRYLFWEVVTLPGD